MHSKARPATKAEKERWDQFRRTGCVACRQESIFNPGEVQHMLDGGRRMGHGDTYCLCPWHHRGLPAGTLTVAQMTLRFGPSLAIDAKNFYLRYGNQADLLAYQNLLLAEDAQ